MTFYCSNLISTTITNEKKNTGSKKIPKLIKSLFPTVHIPEICNKSLFVGNDAIFSHESSFVSKTWYPWLYNTFDLSHFVEQNTSVYSNWHGEYPLSHFVNLTNLYEDWQIKDKVDTELACFMLFNISIIQYPSSQAVYFCNYNDLCGNINLFDGIFEKTILFPYFYVTMAWL